MKKLNKGFTLVELIIVIAILAIIMLIAIPNFSGIQQRMQVRADKQTAAQIGKAIRIWYAERVSEGLSVASLPAINSSNDGVLSIDSTATDSKDALGDYGTTLTGISDYISTTNKPTSLSTDTGAKSTVQMYAPVLTGTDRTSKIMVVIQGDASTGSAATWTVKYNDKLDSDGKIDSTSSTKFAATYNGVEPNIAYIEP